MNNLPLADKTSSHAAPRTTPASGALHARLAPLAGSARTFPGGRLPRSATLGALVLSASLLAACGGGSDAQGGSTSAPVSGGTYITADAGAASQGSDAAPDAVPQSTGPLAAATVSGMNSAAQQAAGVPSAGTPLIPGSLNDAMSTSQDHQPAPIPADDIWFVDALSDTQDASPRQTKAAQTRSTTAPIIVRAPSFGPAGQRVRVGTPITRVPGTYRNGTPVAGFRSRDGQDIPDGRRAVYTPTQADAGKKLVYRERVINTQTGESVYAYSEPVYVESTDPAASTPPVANHGPLIASGNTRIRAGRQILATAGDYQYGQVAQRQWLRNGTPIPNATTDRYTPGSADVGQKLSYIETVRNPANGQTIRIESQQALVVGAYYPSIHTQPSTSAAGNVAEMGQKLVGKSGTYQWGSLHINYWLKNGQVLASGAEYTPTDADIGATIVYVEKIVGIQGDEVYLSAPAVKIVASRGGNTGNTGNAGNTGNTGNGGNSGNAGGSTGSNPGAGNGGSSNTGTSGNGSTTTPVTPPPQPVTPGQGGNQGGTTQPPSQNQGGNTGNSGNTGNAGNTGSTGTSGQETVTPRPQPAVADICDPVLNRHIPLKKGQETAQVPNRSIPATGVAVQEPTYGTCEVRVTHNGQLGAGEKRHRSDYSRRQAFNADNSKILMYASDGYWHLYDAHTAKYEKVLNGPGGDAEPQWHPTNPNILYYVPNNGLGMTITELNVATNQRRVVGDLGARLKSFWPNAATAWTKSEGAPSADGRYWCLMVDDYGWQGVGVVTWDMKEDRIIGHMNLNSRPDHVSMSPSGKYCVVSWAYNGMGTRAYTRDFTSPHNPAVSSQPYVQLHSQSEHSDLALNRNREDVYVAIDYQSGGGDVFMVNLDTGKRTNLFPTYLSGTATALHISGKAYDKPGWALVSTYAEYNASNSGASIRNQSLQQWFHRKVFAVSLEANPQIRPLAHADSTAYGHWGENAYWAEPQATVNRDFTRVLFNTNLNSPNFSDVETYMVGLNRDALDK